MSSMRWTAPFCDFFANVAPILRNSLTVAKRQSRDTATPPRQWTMDSLEKAASPTPQPGKQNKADYNDPVPDAHRLETDVGNQEFRSLHPCRRSLSSGCLGCVFGMQHCADLRLAEGAGASDEKKKKRTAAAAGHLLLGTRNGTRSAADEIAKPPADRIITGLWTAVVESQSFFASAGGQRDQC